MGASSGGGSGGGVGSSIRRVEDVALRLRVAEEYAQLANAVAAHKEMLFDYGHSLVGGCTS
jgi:hypothetical protein